LADDPPLAACEPLAEVPADDDLEAGDEACETPAVEEPGETSAFDEPSDVDESGVAPDPDDRWDRPAADARDETPDDRVSASVLLEPDRAGETAGVAVCSTAARDAPACATAVRLPRVRAAR
jgi:hypothetical protein